MDLEITPYVGVGPLIFGMSEAQTLAILGEPQSRFKTHPYPGIAVHYPTLFLGFDLEDRLDHVAFGKEFPGKLTLAGIDLLQDPAAFEKLLALDQEVYTWVGFLYLMGLGLQLEGFQEPEDAGRCVAIFPRGRHDRNLPKFTPYSIIRHL